MTTSPDEIYGKVMLAIEPAFANLSQHELHQLVSRINDSLSARFIGHVNVLRQKDAIKDDIPS